MAGSLAGSCLWPDKALLGLFGEPATNSIEIAGSFMTLHITAYFLASLCNALLSGESGNSIASSVSRFRPAALSEAGVRTEAGRVTCTRT